MQKRLPQAREFANSTAKLSIILHGRNGLRSLELSPGVAATLATLVVVVATVYAAATGYLIFKDDLLRSTLAGQARMQYAYEDRIAQLRAQIDRVASRQLIDQDTVESKLHELISRQVQLESRQVLVAKISDDAARLGVRAPDPRPAIRPDSLPTGSFSTQAPSANPPLTNTLGPLFQAPRAKPLPDGLPVRLPQPVEELRTERLSQMPTVIDKRAVPGLIDRAQAVSGQLAARQVAVLRHIEQAASVSARRVRSALDETGLDPQRFSKLLARPAPPTSAMGGPLVPMTNGDAAAFEKSLIAAQNHLMDSERYTKVLRTMPLQRPLARDHETTSTFGTRLDPFTRGMALHTGLDFRATTGTPIRATADGKVIESGWVGGYGRMVEIDHGFGITTRYGHMSALEVAVGDVIKRGQVVGYVGSSGRSTGPHLHYEVRIDDDAVNPLAFLRAGEKSGAE